MKTKNQAIREARAEADAIIEQRTRQARGWDRGAHRDDVRIVDRCWHPTIEQSVRMSVNHAFAMAARFAQVQA